MEDLKKEIKDALYILYITQLLPLIPGGGIPGGPLGGMPGGGIPGGGIPRPIM